MKLTLSPDLTTLRAKALKEIQRKASTARGWYTSDGVGQEQEYQRTAEEARSFTTPADPADYPMLEAERQAQIEAGVTPQPTLQDVADQVLAEEQIWLTVGSEIKKRRRKARIQVNQASSPAQIDAAVAALDYSDLAP